MKKLILFIGAVSLLAACGPTYSDEDLSNFDKEITEYLKKKDIECTKSGSGLYYKILEQGDGKEIMYKDEVSFTYKGEFLDGKVFDEQTEPVTFKVDVLIAAWKEVMLELNEDGKAFLVAPPSLGYGTHDLEDIPKNSILVYELHVTSVK
jgi:FKBP-type peptidyl-prolyl cis-trans isomerase